MKIIGLLVIGIVMLGTCSLAYAIHETSPAETQIPLPGADAGKLYEYITKHKPYTTWGLWPGKGKMYKGTEPHGDFLTTYINDIGMAGIKSKKPLPDGSIIAKENYSADKKFVALSVMYKLNGFNPAAADWFWAKYDADGRVTASGKVDACITCHKKNMNNDYLFTGEIGK